MDPGNQVGIRVGPENHFFGILFLATNISGGVARCLLATFPGAHQKRLEYKTNFFTGVGSDGREDEVFGVQRLI